MSTVRPLHNGVKETSLKPEDFLRAIWPKKLLRRETLELRVIDRKTRDIHTEFAESIDDFLERAARYKEREVYFGIATRFGDEGGKKQNCYRVHTLWCDLDKKSLEECHQFDPAPSILVESGGGVHAYWLLKTPVSVLHHLNDIEAVARGLARKFGGDRNACDVSRILRVPSFHNHKYVPAREVKAYANGAASYSLEDFSKLGIWHDRPEPEGLGTVALGNVRSVPDELRARLDTVGGGGFNDASREDLSCVDALFKYITEPSDVYATFAASARGKDAAERHVFDDYMQRTISKAKGGKLEDKGDSIVEIDFGGKHNDKANLRTKSGAILEQLDLIEPERTDWLWKPYIPLIGLTILAGDPETGKSQIVIDLTSRVSRMSTMPLCDQRTRGNCIIATAEDHTSKTIVPRLCAVGADRSRIHTLRQVQVDRDQPPRYLSIPRDLQIIHDTIRDHSVKLFVIDPLNAFLGGSINTFRDHDIRLALGPLEHIAEILNCAIVIVMHLNKKEDVAALYRVSGSIGHVGAARSVLGVAKLASGGSVMYSLKNNLARRPPALKYAIVEAKIQNADGEDLKTSRVKWIGHSDYDPEKAKGEPQQLKESRNFFATVLVDGEVATDDVMKQAKAAGIAWRTLNQYKHQLGVTSKKGRDGRWYYVRLPKKDANQ